MLVKICGISNIIDAMWAIENGADALGFVMGGKILPIEVEPHAQEVREIIKKFPTKVDSFLVTHLTNIEDIVDLSNYINSTGIQVSEDIPVDQLAKLKEIIPTKKIIKTITVEDEQSLINLKIYEPFCDFLLLDSKVNGYTGGTGVTSDWKLCKKLIQLAQKPVFLAGGLTPSNISSAIQETNPDGVDVSTGISTFSPEYLKKDRKSEIKIKTFIDLAKNANAE